MADGHNRQAHGGRSATPQVLLQVWLSPSFPVGAFAYSHGLEKAVENGWVRDRASLEDWIGDLVALGALRNDLILLAAVWRAAAGSSPVDVRAIAELAAALQPTSERHLEATQQGRSFIDTTEAAWPSEVLNWSDISENVDPTYPVAVGFVAASHGVPLTDTLNAYALAFAGNLVSAAIRLSVVGQTDAQRIIAALLDRLLAAAAAGEAASLDDLGGAAWRSDIASMQHEVQSTRLFRS